MAGNHIRPTRIVGNCGSRTKSGCPDPGLLNVYGYLKLRQRAQLGPVTRHAVGIPAPGTLRGRARRQWHSPLRTGSRPVYFDEARSSAIACTSRMCRPQNSEICSNVSAVVSTSHEAVACGIKGVGWVDCDTGFLRCEGPGEKSQGPKTTGPPLSERPLEPSP